MALGLGSALVAEPSLLAMDGFALTSSVNGREVTYTLTSKAVTPGNCFVTAVEFQNNSSVSVTQIPNGWTAVTNGSFIDLNSGPTNLLGKSISFTLQSATGGFSLRTNGAALGFSFTDGVHTNVMNGYCMFNCLIPDNSSANMNPPAVTSTYNWPPEVKFVGISPTNMSIAADTDVQVQLQSTTNLTSWSNFGSSIALSRGTNDVPYVAQDPQRYFRTKAN